MEETYLFMGYFISTIIGVVEGGGRKVEWFGRHVEGGVSDFLLK